MKYTKVQEKGRGFADNKIKGEKGITQLFTIVNGDIVGTGTSKNRTS